MHLTIKNDGFKSAIQIIFVVVEVVDYWLYPHDAMHIIDWTERGWTKPQCWWFILVLLVILLVWIGYPYQCLLCDLLSPFLSLYIPPPFVGNLKYIFALESFDDPMISGS